MITPWIFGRSGSGKTTIATLLAAKILEETDKTPFIIDGDVLRKAYGNDLGFSKKDRIAQAGRAVAMVAGVKAVSKEMIFPIVALITPLHEIQNCIADDPGFKLLYLHADIETVENRDTKGLYKKKQVLGPKDVSSIYYFDNPSPAIYGIDSRFRSPDKILKEIWGMIDV